MILSLISNVLDMFIPKPKTVIKKKNKKVLTKTKYKNKVKSSSKVVHKFYEIERPYGNRMVVRPPVNELDTNNFKDVLKEFVYDYKNRFVFGTFKTNLPKEKIYGFVVDDSLFFTNYGLNRLKKYFRMEDKDFAKLLIRHKIFSFSKDSKVVVKKVKYGKNDSLTLYTTKITFEGDDI